MKNWIINKLIKLLNQVIDPDPSKEPVIIILSGNDEIQVNNLKFK